MRDERRQAALDRFDGRRGMRRVNCAEAIIRGYLGQDGVPEEKSLYRRLGRGRAPGGECGACYAGRFVLERLQPESVGALEDAFRDETGSTVCRDIRSANRASCRECVEAVCDFLSSAT